MPTHSPSGRPLHWWERLGLWMAMDALWEHREEAQRMGREAGQRQGFLDAEGVPPQRLKAAYLSGFTDGIVSALQEPGEPSTTARAPLYIDRKDLDQCFRDSDFDLRHTSESLRHTLRPGETAADDHEPHDACTTTAQALDYVEIPSEGLTGRDPLTHAEPVFSQAQQERALYDIEKVGHGVRVSCAVPVNSLRMYQGNGMSPVPVLGGLAGDGLDAEVEIPSERPTPDPLALGTADTRTMGHQIRQAERELAQERAPSRPDPLAQAFIADGIVEAEDGGHPRVDLKTRELPGPEVPDTDRHELGA